ncbi:UDP-4-amino-4,6-dideoxy-N-acetyl-beta-L-altrosamine N-acetyltransferase [Salinicola halimionae]|uniref:UDP-4-amino-4, 6-dideoxy-N-acetyl-beta-L-altrosamine N-acetyltransferase n=1 Tax=Salinicola halimionae TaxID=1949081 RepID=UPI000DA16E78|nr:UDP-4-amino-4,6-dideoxy-N-acetyl-beta-L-altrosamine N-acetyltransferase [Salinicola halimionae]
MPLRNIVISDLELMLEWRNHPHIRSKMFFQNIIQFEHHKEWFLKEAKKENSDWLLYSDTKGNKLGVVYFTNIDRFSSHAFWGLYIDPEAPSGTGTKLALEALDYIFKEKELHKINAEVLENNQRSEHFHKKLGFTVEGQFREQYWDGASYQYVTRFGLFALEWESARKALTASRV